MDAHHCHADKSATGTPRAWLIGGAALALLLGGYWYFNQQSAPRRAPRSSLIPVRVAQVERRDMAVIERTLGTVVPFTTVQVAARVQGMIDLHGFQGMKANWSRRAIFCL